jgi:hypothetical protein
MRKEITEKFLYEQLKNLFPVVDTSTHIFMRAIALL